MTTSTSKKIIAGAASAALVATGAGVALADYVQNPNTSINPDDITTNQIDERDFTDVKNIEGTFAFNQEGVTPNDELFNVFGTALTSMCSQPAVEMLDPEGASAVANYYINVGGNVKKSFMVDLKELSSDEKTVLMGCSCATGSSFGQAAVVGVPLASVVNLTDLDEGVNTVTAYGADGFGQALPLQYALDKNALLVYNVNGQELKSTDGSSAQLWMPETVARYFTRDIMNIEFTAEEKVPDIQQMEPRYRNKINILNYSDDCLFFTGHEITFEGVADDCGSPIVAVEFSMDGGNTWTSCSTEGATADKWVNWKFTTSFEDAGDYRLTVRAKTADGIVSPIEASLFFKVM